MRKEYFLIALIAFLSSCGRGGAKAEDTKTTTVSDMSIYTGTASVSRGLGTIEVENIFDCDRGRKAPVGTSTAIDGSTWTVPSSVNFTDNSFPFASDLYNPCTRVEHKSVNDALTALDGTDIIEIDADGEIVTAFVFADNYFEMYVNGIPVGKDNVPFTQFNSNIVRFKVSRPFSIAMKLVDWEEHLGVGCEANRGKSFHAGDGGMVAVIKDAQNNILATTNKNWKAQTFYTAPITDIACASEDGAYRYSKNCDTSGGQDGTSFYALHWKVPSDWMQTNFNDSNWPNASTYTNKTIGVDNKPSYTNFIDVFDDKSNDAEFIWSTNVVLDNEVLVRYTVK